MGMKPDSLFVQQIFQLADTDKSGYLSFTEFADLIILLMKGDKTKPCNHRNVEEIACGIININRKSFFLGSPEQKAKMLFEMYDVDQSGEITRDQANAMIR